MNKYDETRRRALNITMSFEGTGYKRIAGNFDGQGWTFGILGFNLGQGTLQELLRAFKEGDPKAFRECCTVYVDAYKSVRNLSGILVELCAMSNAEAVKWSLKRQEDGIVSDHWQEVFDRLGAHEGFQMIQRQFAEPYFERARQYCIKSGMTTDRAFCIFFDICVQQGSLRKKSIVRIASHEFKAFDYRTKLLKVVQMAKEQAASKWAEDVFDRKSTIFRGRGDVHGFFYNLDADYGLNDREVVDIREGE